VAKIRIAFDQQVFLLQQYGGISRYFCCLAEALSDFNGVEARIIAPIHFNLNLKTKSREDLQGIFLPQLNTKLFRLAFMVGTFLAKKSINLYHPDIVHETYYSLKDDCPVGAKRVLTVYDMIHEKFSDSFEQSNSTSNAKLIASQRADHVICISENTQQDLISLYQIPKEKTSVVYLGVDEVFTVTSKVIDHELQLPKNFILFVGKRSGYKNFEGFLKAFSASRILKNGFTVICFGGDSLNNKELKLAESIGVRPEQLLHFSGDDDLLASLYRQASALIYPSLYEGFGLPPLEAMASGCPVICSNTSSLPEVVGTAGEYFDPHSQSSMMEAMEKVLGSTDRKNELINSGFQQAAKFRWEKCAQETMQIYKSLL